MKLNRMLYGTLTAATLCWTLAAFAGLEVKTEKENVVGSRLIGKWKTHASLSERLQGNAGREETAVFVEDKTIAAKVPDRYAEALKQKPIYSP